MHRFFVFILSFSLSLISRPVFSQQMRWSDPLTEQGNVIRGQGWPQELEGTYQRLPSRAEHIVRPAVWRLSENSAGLSVAFMTNSPSITVRYGVSDPFSMDHIPATGVSGVDLYSYDREGIMRWYGSDNKRSFRDTVTYIYDGITYKGKEGFEFHLYLPYFNNIEWLEIGTEAGSNFEFLPSDTRKPIVIYGTSIVHGACASRPGMIWTNIVERETRYPAVNLGFSGNALMESEIFDFISEIDASLFIIDAMPNMDHDNEQFILERTISGIKKIRSRSNAPILLIQHAGYANAPSSEERTANCRACNIQLKMAFDSLVNEGIESLYLLPEEANRMEIDDMVEGWHPNDVGMKHIANAVLQFVSTLGIL